ncbi:PepSY domain-containing protein [Chitinibacter sp. ZOR0017]|uniref:PepSY domain-containing protein n=1 Tax=Chitinibacter sp. ZOR0017 TaxID=1339254 RepID=UPI0006490CFA|nr:PepSY domain-containing protein [Chitinibacter sp. ZOR0017]
MKRDDLTLDAALRPPRAAGSALGWLTRWHRKLAWVAGLAVLAWGLTGVLHPIMSALTPTVQPLPPAAALPADLQPVPLAQLALPAGPIQSVRLRMLGEIPAWRIGQPGQAQGLWFDARSGALLPQADAQEAERLARVLVGDAHSPVRQLTPVYEFSRSYPAINKILPVWRVEFARADGMVAFVDTEGRRLASLSDRTKRTLMPVFSLLHTWSWASESVKRVGITVLLVLVLASMAGGLAMYVLRWQKGTLKAGQKPLRRWHRGLGVALGLAGIVLTASGLTHLWLQRAPYVAASPKPLAVLPELHHLPAQTAGLTAVNVQGQAYWLQERAKPAKSAQPAAGGHQHHAPAALSNALPIYLDAHGMAQPGLALVHAGELVRQVQRGELAGPVKQVQLIERFGGEYGFFQKRLPVYRVDLANAANSSWYIEPATGTFSTRVEDADRFEGWLFAYLHKWHWLDGLGKSNRDLILASAAAANVALAVLGLLLWRRKRPTAAAGR